VSDEEPEKIRVSGRTAAEEAALLAAAEAEDPVNPELPEERARTEFKTPGFSRMQLGMDSDSRAVMAMVHDTVEQTIFTEFYDLYLVLHELYELVRTPVMDGDLPRREPGTGLTVWARNETGAFIEDWGKLGGKERERFLFLINTRIFEWQEKRDRMWADSMYAKTRWEEAFAIGWRDCESGKRTEGDRTSAGRLGSVEERYYAIFVTYLSRRADSLVRNMEQLAQRIKDVHTA
jgi:hypothetical protein